ncbi:MAG: beta-N-acetylhexosaminidase [Magnetococcales bacterium]|nr:beta-N-acetylhexosaminidase [Magnetococcales bacterium]
MVTSRAAGGHLVVALKEKALTREERAWFREVRPRGVFLFGRNIEALGQVRELIAEVREAAGEEVTLWIDQEGGRVQRLRAPFTRYPNAMAYGRLARRNPGAARELARLAGRLCGWELASLGIGVDCAPVLDILEDGADPVIGDRAFGTTPGEVIPLAGAWLHGLTGSGVMGMGKHFPGHGAAAVDSHRALPVVDKSLEGLLGRELVPFKALAGELPAVMTAHLIVSGVDPGVPATWSRRLLVELLRGEWGYRGLIVTDALEMGALSGGLEARARRALLAGCDLMLCCTGNLADSEATLEGVAEALRELPRVEREGSEARVERVLSRYRLTPGDPWQLLKEPRYLRAREEVESLAGDELGKDPTEVSPFPL